MVGFDGQVRLLDFGLAKATAEASKTRAGVLKGKYAYMSPEQAEGGSIDVRSDLFSAGIVLWELLTLRRLFWRGSDMETMRAVSTCRVPFVRGARLDVPWSVAWSSFRALRRWRWVRFGSAASMRHALLMGETRSTADAHNELADWLSQLFESELRLREAALTKVRHEPQRFRQVRDAGFELVEEATEPGVRRRPGFVLPLVPSGMASGGWMLWVAAVLGTWRWFLPVFLSFVLLCAAAGVYLGRSHASAEHGYLYVFSDEAGVRVMVGGTEVGQAPVQRIAVLPGSHRITGRRGNRVTSVQVTVLAGENRVVQLRFPVERQ